MVVTAIWVDTGRQEIKGTGMEFLIYLAKVVISLLAQEKSKVSIGPSCSKLFWFPCFPVLDLSLVVATLKS